MYSLQLLAMAMELKSMDVPAPDSDAETPPRGAAATKRTAFSAYSFKRPHCVSPARPVVFSYRECMRNHAAGMGGHALDGCCEFMPPSAANSGDAQSLCCAACGCHRNFHRRDPDDPAPLQLHPAPELETAQFLHNSCTIPPATRSFYSGHHLSLKKTFPGSAPADNSPASGSAGAGGRKRFRTKFTQEQKRKMFEFSENLGWKLQKIDKGIVQEFCNEIGIGREVLKVWMHNNKNTLGRREISNPVNGGIINGGCKNDGDPEAEKLAGNGSGGSHNGFDLKDTPAGCGNGSPPSSG